MLPEELEIAYRRTIYRADFPDGSVEIRVGRSHPALDRRLAAHGAAHWAWLTAVNPRSRQLSADENRERLDALQERLDSQKCPNFPGEALDPDGLWPVEPSLLVLGLDRARLLALAAELDQHAWLEGEAGGVATLVTADGTPC